MRHSRDAMRETAPLVDYVPQAPVICTSLSTRWKTKRHQICRTTLRGSSHRKKSRRQRALWRPPLLHFPLVS